MAQRSGIVVVVTDGVTTVRPVNTIQFAEGSVTDLGGGKAGVAGGGGGVSSFNSRTGVVTLTLIDVQAVIAAAPTTPSVGLWRNGNIVCFGTIG